MSSSSPEDIEDLLDECKEMHCEIKQQTAEMIKLLESLDLKRKKIKKVKKQRELELVESEKGN